MEEKDETLEKLKKELAKLTAPTKRQLALEKYEKALNELVELEGVVQAKQKAHQEALGELQRALTEKDGADA